MSVRKEITSEFTLQNLKDCLVPWYYTENEVTALWRSAGGKFGGYDESCDHYEDDCVWEGIKPVLKRAWKKMNRRTKIRIQESFASGLYYPNYDITKDIAWSKFLLRR